MKKMNILHVNNSLESYVYPIVKILFFVLLIMLIINRGQFVHIDNEIFNIVIGVICAFVCIVCIYCIGISFSEFLVVHDNRTKTNTVSTQIIRKSKELSVDEIVSMANNNDIIEIEILSNGEVVEIGSSSDCKPGKTKFFNKLFYVDKKEYKSIEEFQNAIEMYSNDGKIAILSIDGVSPRWNSDFR